MANEPRIPEVGEYVRGAGKLIAVVDSRPVPPPPKDYIFQSICARFEVRRRGKVLDTGSTYNDFYGLETSVAAAIESAKEYVASEEIAPDSELEVVVVRVVEYGRMRPNMRDVDGSVYDRRFRTFDYVQPGCKWDVPEDVETDVWSSRSPSPEPEVTNGE